MRGHARQALIVLFFACPVPAFAQDPADGARPASAPQLPAIRAQVERFTLAPGGEVDGLLLVDGTEVDTPPHLSARMVATIRPGDVVTVRGLKAASLPLVQAVTIEDERTGRMVVDEGLSAPPEAVLPAAGVPMRREGWIRMLLHGPRGDVNGLLLADGTVVRIDPIEAPDVSDALRPGSYVMVDGEGRTSAYGTVIRAMSFGARAVPASPVKPP